MNFRKRKINLLKNILIIGFLSLFLSLAPVQTPKTQAFWGEIVESMLDQALRTAYDTMLGMINGMLKQQGATMLSKMVDKLASGRSSGEAAFITNWQDYLVQQPQGQAQAYMNDYLSQITSGRNSYTGYNSEGFFQTGAGSYFSDLGEVAKVSLDPMMLQPSYEGSPSEMFDEGSFKKMESYASGTNNPWAFDASFNDAYEEKLADEKDVARTLAISYQGFVGTGNDGTGQNVAYPGILAKEDIANVNNIPNMSLATATHMGEVISAVVTTVITRSMQQGFSGAQRSIQRNVTDVKNRASSGMNNLINTSGPGVLYGN